MKVVFRAFHNYGGASAGHTDSGFSTPADGSVQYQGGISTQFHGLGAFAGDSICSAVHFVWPRLFHIDGYFVYFSLFKRNISFQACLSCLAIRTDFKGFRCLKSTRHKIGFIILFVLAHGDIAYFTSFTDIAICNGAGGIAFYLYRSVA